MGQRPENNLPFCADSSAYIGEYRDWYEYRRYMASTVSERTQPHAVIVTRASTKMSEDKSVASHAVQAHLTTRKGKHFAHNALQEHTNRPQISSRASIAKLALLVLFAKIAPLLQKARAWLVVH